MPEVHNCVPLLAQLVYEAEVTGMGASGFTSWWRNARLGDMRVRA